MDQFGFKGRYAEQKGMLMDEELAHVESLEKASVLTLRAEVDKDATNIKFAVREMTEKYGVLVWHTSTNRGKYVNPIEILRSVEKCRYRRLLD